MGSGKGVGLAGALLVLAVPAQAETLLVDSVYPAGNSRVAYVNAIAIEPFGGTDGPSLSIRVEDQLRAVMVRNDRWFDVVPATLTPDADAVLRGAVSTRVWTDRAGEQERQFCVERDARDKCIRREKRKVRCWDLQVSVRPTIRLIAIDGELLHSDESEVARSRRYCATDDRPDEMAMVEEALDEIAGRVRNDLAPRHVREGIRVLEARKGMEKSASNAFKDAIRTTKSDEAAACASFVELEPTIGEHESLLFNIGLCHEQNTRWEDAEAYYNRALEVNGRNSAASAGLGRLRQYRVAEQQMSAHYSE